MNTSFISIIIPAYNESPRIGQTLENVANYLDQAKYSYEILVVNDGSVDATSAVVQKLQFKIPQLRLINNLKNMGKGYAVKSGMLAAVGDLRLFMDADNSVKINEIENFLAEINKGFDVVVGSIGLAKKRVAEKNGWYRRPLGRLAKFIIRFLATPGIYDTQRGFKLFTKKAAEIIFPKLTVNRFGFDIELLVIAQVRGLKIKELPVQFDNPQGSTVGLTSYFATFFELIKIVGKKYLGQY